MGQGVARVLRDRLLVGTPLVLAVALSAVHLPGILMRFDDGHRGARLIDANGVRLVWAPAGPGWNWRQSWGGYPAWDSLAFYGVPPAGLKTSRETGPRHATAAEMARTGLCGYLNAEGTAVVAEPLHIWRMPTAEEFVRSLTSNNGSAGCTWDGNRGHAPCLRRTEKETPLWAPDAQPIYMWTSERSPDEAWYVNYGLPDGNPRASATRGTATAASKTHRRQRWPRPAPVTTADGIRIAPAVPLLRDLV